MGESMSRKWGSAPSAVPAQETPKAAVSSPSPKALCARFSSPVIVGSGCFTRATRPDLVDLGVICVLNEAKVLVPWANVTCVELEG